MLRLQNLQKVQSNLRSDDLACVLPKIHQDARPLGADLTATGAETPELDRYHLRRGRVVPARYPGTYIKAFRRTNLRPLLNPHRLWVALHDLFDLREQIIPAGEERVGWVDPSAALAHKAYPREGGGEVPWRRTDGGQISSRDGGTRAKWGGGGDERGDRLLGRMDIG